MMIKLDVFTQVLTCMFSGVTVAAGKYTGQSQDRDYVQPNDNQLAADVFSVKIQFILYA